VAFSAGADSNSTTNLFITAGATLSTGTGPVSFLPTSGLLLGSSSTFNANGDLSFAGTVFDNFGALTHSGNISASQNARLNFNSLFNLSHGTLTIQSGAHFVTTNVFDVADAPGQSATLIVDGTGSSFSA